MAAAAKLILLLTFVTWAMIAAPYMTATVAESALTCGQVVGSLIPCIDYLQNGGDVSSACCNGVRSLNDAAETTDDRQKACNCLKSTANTYPKAKDSFAAALPDACGVDIHIPYKISRDIDCKS
ncbi:unnamed protein product [Linum trigynum]|uniref:Non-specific lipid-transfer protein n=1 Tax=Linum trigynum TaxID=586398 RepID=A0AAV2DXQ5_9ROSI